MSHAALRPTTLLALLTLTACGDDAPMEPVGPAAPTAVITSPASGFTVNEGTPVRLVGSATDPQDGTLGDAALAWSSSIDGALGTGSPLEVASPSVGVHTITLTATDSDGNTGAGSVSVLVEELEFLDGTVRNAEIGIVVNSRGKAIRLFQLGDPDEQPEIPLGASSAVTPTGLAVRGETAVVPLGNAASVAVIDLRTQQPNGFFLFESGNATGSAFVDDRTVLAANQKTDQVGKFSLGQAGDAIGDLVSVTPFPTGIVPYADSLAFVISANLDDNFAPAGDGVVTAIDPRTMIVTAEIETGGTNAQFGAIGPDGMLYVTNTGDYVAPSTLAIIDPVALARVDVAGGFPAGSGHVHVSPGGTLFVSAFSTGTVAWNTATKAFVRDGSDPICAPLDGGGCRGAFAAHTAADGSLYQTFFGSVSAGLPPQIFLYAPETYALTDSIDSGLGPVGLEIRSFRRGAGSASRRP
ncbi:MAG: hypothetical protein OXI83_05710 [Gemmatimonadota bacterium]|nr:hypothetical protein [Gemmatimonadota bacterium]